jgi:hypothetical protein
MVTQFHGKIESIEPVEPGSTTLRISGPLYWNGFDHLQPADTITIESAFAGQSDPSTIVASAFLSEDVPRPEGDESTWTVDLPTRDTGWVGEEMAAAVLATVTRADAAGGDPWQERWEWAGQKV